jgi:RNA binding activity-knot of a chromodomain
MGKNVVRNLIATATFVFGLCMPWIASAQPICSVNDHVSVYWAKPGENGKWYSAMVLRVNDTQTRCYVRYHGYDSQWDEWVDGSRLKRASTPSPAKGVEYSIAHVKSQDNNWVFVKVSPRFLTADEATIRKWYTDVQACVRRVNLAGDVVVVTTVDGSFRFWGPIPWRKYLSTLDMNWVNARVNKSMTCYF